MCVRACMAMNNALAVGVFIYNTLKMFACEPRGTLKASLPNLDQYRSAVSSTN